MKGKNISGAYTPASAGRKSNITGAHPKASAGRNTDSERKPDPKGAAPMSNGKAKGGHAMLRKPY